jgi:hypothetical protein
MQGVAKLIVHAELVDNAIFSNALAIEHGAADINGLRQDSMRDLSSVGWRIDNA